jgi:hypothetical protein
MERRQYGHAILFSAILLFLAVAVPCGAFHSGGIGDCGGCHDMHLAPGTGGTATGGNPHFLIAVDAGSTCLRCHQAAGESRPNGHLVSTADADMPPGIPPVQLTPGGDFGWLKKSYRWEAGELHGAGDSPGEHHGHNIVAADFQYRPDTVLTMAPGGNYPSSELSCISCHDPHGKYRRFAHGSIGMEGAPIQSSGSYDTSPKPTATMAVGVYRLLGGKGYSTAATRNAAFLSDPPAAVAPAEYNREETGHETRVAYGSGMSEWCTNCHAALLTGSEGARVHPSGKNVRLSPAVIANYNAYVASGNLTGSRATAYTSMVPYEMGTADYDLLQRTASSNGGTTTGPDPDANVACLSCHRAHASGWDHAVRWNMKTEFLVFNGDYPGVEDTAVPPRVSQGRTRSETRRTFYGRPASRYAKYQRSLCNKCHAKD